MQFKQKGVTCFFGVRRVGILRHYVYVALKRSFGLSKYVNCRYKNVKGSDIITNRHLVKKLNRCDVLILCYRTFLKYTTIGEYTSR